MLATVSLTQYCELRISASSIPSTGYAYQELYDASCWGRPRVAPGGATGRSNCPANSPGQHCNFYFCPVVYPTVKSRFGCLSLLLSVVLLFRAGEAMAAGNYRTWEVYNGGPEAMKYSAL